MKRLTLLTAILIVTSSLFASCTVVDPETNKRPILNYSTEAQTTASPLPEDSQTPSDVIVPIIGKWYSESGMTLFQFFSDGTVKTFFLAAGVYEYEAIEAGTYTYDGKTLSIALQDESALSSPIVFSDNNFQLTKYGLTFVPVSDLPSENLTSDFPDYTELVKQYPIQKEGLVGLQADTSAFWKTAIESVQATYWNGMDETDMIRITDRPVIEGDQLNINYEGLLNGIPFDGGTKNSVRVTAKDGTGMIDGFCSGLIGHSVGETFDVAVTFPQNYHSAEMAGKSVIFRMTINAIYDLTVTDEMAQSKDYESFEAWVREIYDSQLRKNIFSFFPTLKNAEVPKEAYQFFFQQNYANLLSIANSYNLSIEFVFSIYGTSEEKLLEDCRELGKNYLHAAGIVDAFDLTPTEDQRKAVTDEMIADLVSGGYSQEAATELVQGEAKPELESRLNLLLAENFLLEQNTFSYQK